MQGEAIRCKLPTFRPPGSPEVQQGHGRPLFNLELSSNPTRHGTSTEILDVARPPAFIITQESPSRSLDVTDEDDIGIVIANLPPDVTEEDILDALEDAA